MHEIKHTRQDSTFHFSFLAGRLSNRPSTLIPLLHASVYQLPRRKFSGCQTTCFDATKSKFSLAIPRTAVFPPLLPLNLILGLQDSESQPLDGKPNLQMHYANGPGYYYHRTVNGTDTPRKNLTGVDTGEYTSSMPSKTMF